MSLEGGGQLAAPGGQNALVGVVQRARESFAHLLREVRARMGG